MHAIYNYQGALVVRSALQIMALTFCRRTEIRCAECLNGHMNYSLFGIVLGVSSYCRSDFIRWGKLAASQKLEPGRTDKGLGVFFGVEIPDAFKIQ